MEILVGMYGESLRLVGPVFAPMTKDQAIMLAARLSVMAGDDELVKTKDAARRFTRGDE